MVLLHQQEDPHEHVQTWQLAMQDYLKKIIHIKFIYLD